MTTLTAKSSWIDCSKATILLALPVLGAHLIEAIIPFFNITLSASLGENALAAAGLVGSTFLALMGFCWGVVAAVGILVANKIGEEQTPKNIGVMLWAGFITSLLLSLPVMLAFGCMDKVWSLFGQDTAVIEQAHAYMNGMLLAVPADLAKFAIFQFAIACGKPRIPLIANALSVPLLIVINQYLITQFGIYGIGLGTSITYWLVFAAMFAYLFTNKVFRNYLLHRYQLPEFTNSIREQFKLGVPIGLMFSIELIFFMVFALLMGNLGSISLAANQIAMQWLWLTVMFVYGFTEAVTILVAKANGANNVSDIVRYTTTGIVLSSLCTLIVGCVYWFAPNLIISVDVSNTENNAALISLAVKLLMFCGVYQLLDGIRIVMAGALRGVEDSKYPMWVTAFAFWAVGLPVGYACAFLCNWRETGLWMGLLSAALVSSVLQYYRLKNKVSKAIPAGEMAQEWR